jgi:hypothetical protein
MMPGILKFLKENHPERAKSGGGRFFHTFFYVESQVSHSEDR